MRNRTRIALAFVLQGLSLAGFADYLPLAGPRPLRFAEPTAAPNLSLLPPLPMDDRPQNGSDAGKKAGDSDSPGADSAPAKPAFEDSVLGAAQSPANQGPANLPPEIITTQHPLASPGFPVLPQNSLETGNEPLLSPQMLVPYFQPSGGTNRVSVTLPLIFSPAAPPAPPSSSATYEKR